MQGDVLLEQAMHQLAGALRDHHRVRVCRGLQSRRQIRRLADDRLLLCGPCADEIAHDRHTGGDADANS